MVEAVVGKSFDSYESIKSFVKEYENSKFVQLCVNSSLKLKPPRRYLVYTKMAFVNRDLVYSSIKFVCVHGGEYKNKGHGIRKSKTIKQGCPFIMKLSLSPDAQTLRISELNEEHNHQISEAQFKSLPKQRLSLTESQKLTVRKMLERKCDKKMIKQHISTVMNKNVTMRDINNMKAKNFNRLKETTHQEDHEPSTSTFTVRSVPPPMVKKSVSPPMTKMSVSPPMTKKSVPPPMIKKSVSPPMTKMSVSPPMTKKSVPPPMIKKSVPLSMIKMSVSPPMTKKSVPPPMIKMSVSPPIIKILNKEEKYKKTMEVCEDIGKIMSDFDTEKFTSTLDKLVRFKNLLLEGQTKVSPTRKKEVESKVEMVDVLVVKQKEYEQLFQRRESKVKRTENLHR